MKAILFFFWLIWNIFLVSPQFFFSCSDLTFHFKGMLLAKDIRDRERGGRAEIGVIEGEAESDSPHSMQILTGVLGQRSSELPDGAPDAAADQEQRSKLTLYQWVPPSPLTMTTPPRLCSVSPSWPVLSGVSVCPMLKVKWRSRKLLPDHWARTSSTMMWEVFSFTFKLLTPYQTFNI